MEFSDRLIYIVTGTYNEELRDYYGKLYPDRVNHDKNNVYQHCIVVDIDKEIFEVPIICKDACESVIKEKDNYSLITKYNKIIFPLYVHGYNFERRTADSILNDFFRNVGYRDRLKKITTNKGEVYYGGKGIILDKDMKPLLLYTIRGKMKSEHEGRNYCEYIKPICRVSPSVFTNQNSIVNKAIIKKVIPILTSRKVFISQSEGFEGVNVEAEVIVGDIGCIQAPNKPTPDKCSNDYFNTILNDNVADILAMI